MNIQEIRERAEKASPGPWYSAWPGDPEEEGKDAAGPLGIVALGNGMVCGGGNPFPSCHANTWEQVENNFKFIAHAREDIPALLARVDGLEFQVKSYEFLVRKHRDLFVTEMAAIINPEAGRVDL